MGRELNGLMCGGSTLTLDASRLDLSREARERCTVVDAKCDYAAGFLRRHGVRQHHVLAGEEICRVAGVAADRTYIAPHDGTSESR